MTCCCIFVPAQLSVLLDDVHAIHSMASASWHIHGSDTKRNHVHKEDPWDIIGLTPSVVSKIYRGLNYYVFEKNLWFHHFFYIARNKQIRKKINHQS